MKDKDRTEYARAVRAHTRIRTVLDLAHAARGEVASITGQDAIVEEALRAIDDAVVAAQMVARKLEIAIPRIP